MSAALLNELIAAGLSRRVAALIAYSGVVTAVAELRERPWKQAGEVLGLRDILASIAGLGDKGMEEVAAIRCRCRMRRTE